MIINVVNLTFDLRKEPLLISCALFIFRPLLNYSESQIKHEPAVTDINEVQSDVSSRNKYAQVFLRLCA